MWKERVRFDDLVGVVKVAHAPDGRFDREIRVLKTLQHPNLIRVYAHDEGFTSQVVCDATARER